MVSGTWEGKTFVHLTKKAYVSMLGVSSVWNEIELPSLVLDAKTWGVRMALQIRISCRGGRRNGAFGMLDGSLHENGIE